MLAMRAEREESNMDFSVETGDSIFRLGGILLTYKHFATIPAEVFSPLINNDLDVYTRRIPKNCISSLFRPDQNCY